MTALGLLYGIVPLQGGTSLEIPAAYTSGAAATTLTVTIHTEQREIDVAGVSYATFICDVEELNSTHFVTEEGLLVRIERTDQPIVVDLVDQVTP